MTDEHPREGWEQQIESLRQGPNMETKNSYSRSLDDLWGDSLACLIEDEPTGKELAASLLKVVEQDIEYYQGHADRLREFKKELLMDLENSRAHNIIDKY